MGVGQAWQQKMPIGLRPETQEECGFLANCHASWVTPLHGEFPQIASLKIGMDNVVIQGKGRAKINDSKQRLHR